MIHGRTAQDCGEVMKKISLATVVKTYSMLFSIVKLKKCSMKYFLEEESNIMPAPERQTWNGFSSIMEEC